MRIIFSLTLALAFIFPLGGLAHAQDGDRQSDLRDRFEAQREAARDRLENRQDAMEERRDETKENMEERKEAMEERRTELQEKIEERKAEMRERMEERREELRAKVQERAHAFLVRLIERFDSAITRLYTLSDRLESRLDKLSDRLETDEAYSYIEQAREHLRSAEVIKAEMESEVDALLSSDAPRDELGTLRELASEGKAELRAAHEDLKNAVQSVRSQAANKPEVDVNSDDEEAEESTGDSALQFCPDEWIHNKMPGVVGDNTPKQYFIVDGSRRELTEFDVDWVEENCDLEIQEVF